jgi:hypothetical protein
MGVGEIGKLGVRPFGSLRSGEWWVFPPPSLSAPLAFAGFDAASFSVSGAGIGIMPGADEWFAFRESASPSAPLREAGFFSTHDLTKASNTKPFTRIRYESRIEFRPATSRDGEEIWK